MMAISPGSPLAGGRREDEERSFGIDEFEAMRTRTSTM